MSEKALFEADYVKSKQVESRSVVQFIFEVDVTMANRVNEILGGFKEPGKQVRVAIARLQEGEN